MPSVTAAWISAVSARRRAGAKRPSSRIVKGRSR